MKAPRSIRELNNMLNAPYISDEDKKRLLKLQRVLILAEQNRRLRANCAQLKRKVDDLENALDNAVTPVKVEALFECESGHKTRGTTYSNVKFAKCRKCGERARRIGIYRDKN